MKKKKPQIPGKEIINKQKQQFLCYHNTSGLFKSKSYGINL